MFSFSTSFCYLVSNLLLEFYILLLQYFEKFKLQHFFMKWRYFAQVINQTDLCLYNILSKTEVTI